LLTKYRFTGPKITLDISELTEEQEKVLRDEGLDIQIEGLDRAPSSYGTSGDDGIQMKVDTTA
jgi:hypothetical protein